MTQGRISLEVMRATLAFDEREDRISLTCALKNHECTVLWLTARLAKQLLPHLMKLVAQLPNASSDKSGRESARKCSVAVRQLSGKHPKAEQAGVVENGTTDAPVVAKLDSTSWVVTAIEVTNGPMLVQLVFRDARGHEPVLLSLEHTQLAKWLEGLRQCYFQAGWTMDGWDAPSAASESSQTRRLALH
jgi:hypothetical protein